MIAVAVFTLVITNSNTVKAEVTYDSARNLSPYDQKRVARYFAEMAYGASKPCAENILMGKIPGVVPRAWLGFLNFIFGADNGCTVAKKAAYGAARIWYSAHQGRYAYYRLYVYKERRRLRPDLCHVWVNVGGRWVVAQEMESIKYSTVGFTKCLGER